MPHEIDYYTLAQTSLMPFNELLAHKYDTAALQSYIKKNIILLSPDPHDAFVALPAVHYVIHQTYSWKYDKQKVDKLIQNVLKRLPKEAMVCQDIYQRGILHKILEARHDRDDAIAIMLCHEILHWAQSNLLPEELDAFIKAKDQNGKTALMYLIENFSDVAIQEKTMRQEVADQITKILQMLSPTIQVFDSFCRFPLHYMAGAAQNNDIQVSSRRPAVLGRQHG